MAGENMLEELTPEQHFWARNGAIIKSIHDLKNALENMDDQTFYYHVNDNKNDFSEWVRGVFKNTNLAEKISLCKTKEEMVKVLNSELNPIEDIPPEPPPNIIQENQTADLPEPEPTPTKIEMPAQKIDEILIREKEIEKKEEKIKEIEDKIERRLELIKNPQTAKFFTKEFMQGLIAGILLAVLSALIYIKFFT
jgi:hypothetical protein